MPEVTALFSRAAGRPLRCEQFPEDRVEAAMGRDAAVMFRWFDRVGYSVDVDALRRRYDIALTRFAELITAAEWAKGRRRLGI